MYYLVCECGKDLVSPVAHFHCPYCNREIEIQWLDPTIPMKRPKVEPTISSRYETE